VTYKGNKKQRIGECGGGVKEGGPSRNFSSTLWGFWVWDLPTWGWGGIERGDPTDGLKVRIRGREESGTF